MTGFEFATSARILFGRGKLAELTGIVQEFGQRALLVTGGDSARASIIQKLLDEARIDSRILSVASEPTVELVREGAKAAQGCEMVIGFGGGSAIDAAKAIAAVATNSGEPLDYLEVVGRGQRLERPPLPFIAIPTTAGTGAEVTRNSVLDSTEHGIKASLRSPSMLAKVALVDPDLTKGLPPGITATTGLDTLTQLIEAYVSCRANPMTDMFCAEGIRNVKASLRRAFTGEDPETRESMSWASLLSGLALANAGLGAVHGLAGPLGGLLRAPHGAICAALLAEVMRTNIMALRAREPEHTALIRYGQIAALLTDDTQAAPEDGVRWVTQLCRDLKIRSLSSYGLDEAEIPNLVGRAAKASSMKGNPVILTNAELSALTTASL